MIRKVCKSALLGFASVWEIIYINLAMVIWNSYTELWHQDDMVTQLTLYS